MSDNPVAVLVEARKTALDNAVYISVAQEDFDTDDVLALAEKFTDWIMTGETPAQKFVRIEAERFFRSGGTHPSTRGQRPVLKIQDEVWKDIKGEDPEST